MLSKITYSLIVSQDFKSLDCKSPKICSLVEILIVLVKRNLVSSYKVGVIARTRL